MTATDIVTGERADLLQALGKQRHFLRFTVRGLTDEQAGTRSTASELCLGGLIKHVADTERNWIDFIERGPSALSGGVEGDEQGAEAGDGNVDDWLAGFRMTPDDTLEGLLAMYQTVADRTDQLVKDLPDLDVTRPLPQAPWFEPGASWSARRVLLHVIAETAQHAGHADILRESIDGAKSMG
jgi:uncharacterized damage-inducible protein DinB